jgi:hypothetical protein
LSSESITPELQEQSSELFSITGLRFIQPKEKFLKGGVKASKKKMDG